MIRFTFAIGSGSASTPAALPGAPIGATNHAGGWAGCGWEGWKAVVHTKFTVLGGIAFS